MKTNPSRGISLPLDQDIAEALMLVAELNRDVGVDPSKLAKFLNKEQVSQLLSAFEDAREDLSVSIFQGALDEAWRRVRLPSKRPAMPRKRRSGKA